MTMFLEKIEKTNDIKGIGAENYNALAEEIRQFLIQSISVTGFLPLRETADAAVFPQIRKAVSPAG